MSTKGPSFAQRAVLWLVVIAVAAVTGAVVWQTGAYAPPPKIALVASTESDYWNDVILGAQHAAAQYDAVLTVHQASEGEGEQTRMLRDLAAQNVDGIAVSPLDAKRQVTPLSEIAANIPLVTFDSDSPLSGRLCFVGTDNYTAGRQTAQLVREALPEGGTVVIATGSLEKDNGRLRRQGLIDALLERSFGPGRPPEPLGEPLVGPDYTVVTTLVDENDRAQAKANIDSMLASGETPDCIVGLYAYNGPAAVDALTEAGKLDDTVVIGFDYIEGTLEAIKAGHIYASMAQDPYHYGFHSVRILADEARGKARAMLPLNTIIDIRCFPIRANSLGEFEAKLQTKRSGEWIRD
ncbi:MAG: substrate-binding domain-containing protein [Planctomycetota bacterium]